MTIPTHLKARLQHEDEVDQEFRRLAHQRKDALIADESTFSIKVEDLNDLEI